MLCAHQNISDHFTSRELAVEAIHAVKNADFLILSVNGLNKVDGVSSPLREVIELTVTDKEGTSLIDTLVSPGFIQLDQVSLDNHSRKVFEYDGAINWLDMHEPFAELITDAADKTIIVENLDDTLGFIHQTAKLYGKNFPSFPAGCIDSTQLLQALINDGCDHLFSTADNKTLLSLANFNWCGHFDNIDHCITRCKIVCDLLRLDVSQLSHHRPMLEQLSHFLTLFDRRYLQAEHGKNVKQD